MAVTATPKNSRIAFKGRESLNSVAPLLGWGVDVDLETYLTDPYQGEWEDFWTADKIARYVDVGFDSVRLAFDFGVLCQATLAANTTRFDYVMAKIETAVDAWIDAGIGVILDNHPQVAVSSYYTGEWVYANYLANTTTDQYVALKSTWASVANTLASRDPEYMAFELFNEPVDQGGAQTWADDIGPDLWAAVRAQAPNHTILIGPANYNNVANIGDLDPTDYDENTGFVVHPYLPWYFSQQNLNNYTTRLEWPPDQNRKALAISTMTDQVNNSSLDAGTKTSTISYLTGIINGYYATEGFPSFLSSSLSTVSDWCTNNSISTDRIFATEFGTPHDSNNLIGTVKQAATYKSIDNWSRDIIAELRSRGFRWSYFSADGGIFGVTDDDESGPGSNGFGNFRPSWLNSVAPRKNDRFSRIVTSNSDLASLLSNAQGGEIFSLDSSGAPYNISINGISPASNVIIRSAYSNGSITPIQSMNIANSDNLVFENLSFVTGGGNIKFIDVTGTNSNLAFKGLTFSGSANSYDTGTEPDGENGIEVSGTIENLTIEDSVFSGNKFPIYIDAVGNNVSIVNNDISHYTMDAIDFFPVGTVNNISVANNYIHNPYGALWSLNHGDMLQITTTGSSHTNVSITGNIFDSNGGTASQGMLLGAEGMINNLTVSGNIVRNGSLLGIVVYNANVASIDHNLVLHDDDVLNDENTTTAGNPAIYAAATGTKTSVVFANNISQNYLGTGVANTTWSDNITLSSNAIYRDDAVYRWFPNLSKTDSRAAWIKKNFIDPANNAGPSMLKNNASYILPSSVVPFPDSAFFYDFVNGLYYVNGASNTAPANTIVGPLNMNSGEFIINFTTPTTITSSTYLFECRYDGNNRITGLVSSTLPRAQLQCWVGGSAVAVFTASNYMEPNTAYTCGIRWDGANGFYVRMDAEPSSSNAAAAASSLTANLRFNSSGSGSFPSTPSGMSTKQALGYYPARSVAEFDGDYMTLSNYPNTSVLELMVESTTGNNSLYAEGLPNTVNYYSSGRMWAGNDPSYDP